MLTSNLPSPAPSQLRAPTFTQFLKPEILCPSFPLSPYHIQEVTGFWVLESKHMPSLPASDSTAPTHIQTTISSHLDRAVAA